MKAKPLSTQKHHSGPFPLFITPGFLELLQISRGQTKPKSFAPSQPNSPVGAKVRAARRGISVVDQAGKTHHFSAARRHEALRRSYGPPAHRDLCRLLLPCACSGPPSPSLLLTGASTSAPSAGTPDSFQTPPFTPFTSFTRGFLRPFKSSVSSLPQPI